MTAGDLFDHPERIVGAVGDKPGVFVIPEIPDAAPEFVREGIARRRILAAEGSCPCGAVITRPSRAERRRAAREGRPAQACAEHKFGCPAADVLLRPAVDEWLEDKAPTELLGETNGSAWWHDVMVRGPDTWCEHITLPFDILGLGDMCVWSLSEGRLQCLACPIVVTSTPGDDADRTCDHCGMVCPRDPEAERIQAVSMRCGRLLVFTGLCPRCVALERP